MRTDTTGKISLDHIYTRPDPRDYFGTLRGLEYDIPQQAKPHFQRLIGEIREARELPSATVLDIGCSYGINAALVKYDVTMGELYDRYAGPDAGRHTRGTLLARDRELLRSREQADRLRFLGLDASENALSYALEAGFLDGAVHADLENGDPTEEQRAQLAGTDLVISTGCPATSPSAPFPASSTPTLAAAMDGAFRAAHVPLRPGRRDPRRRGIRDRPRGRPVPAAEVRDPGGAGARPGPPLARRRRPERPGDRGRLYAQLYISRPPG